LAHQLLIASRESVFLCLAAGWPTPVPIKLKRFPRAQANLGVVGMAGRYTGSYLGRCDGWRAVAIPGRHRPSFTRCPHPLAKF
jgi:hypothetical protein